MRYIREAGRDFERDRAGRAVPRPSGGMLPCGRCAKVPPGAEPVPASAVDPSGMSRRVYEHFDECEAVGWQVPEATDPIVKRHAAVIRRVRRAVEEARQGALAALSAIQRQAHGDRA